MISKKEKASYIRGFSDGEGYVSKYNPKTCRSRRIEIVNTNKELLLMIKGYLLDFGIESVLRTHKAYQENHKDAYRLNITKRRNLILWQKLIGFNHLKKKQRLIKVLKTYKDNKYLWWAPVEKKEAIEMQQQGFSIKKIAEHFERTYYSTATMLSKFKRGIYK